MDLAVFPALNACLNGASAVLLAAGIAFIKRRRVEAHKACMLTACAVSCLFLTSYLYYHFHHGATSFRKTGAVRSLYLAILVSHTALAALVPFLAALTVFHAWRGALERHKRLARWTFPIWMYVSITGVIVYGMLYHL